MTGNTKRNEYVFNNCTLVTFTLRSGLRYWKHETKNLCKLNATFSYVFRRIIHIEMLGKKVRLNNVEVLIIKY